MERFDKIIIGAGLYGLYSAVYAAGKNQKVLVLECDEAPFSRATYINQARVHQGYHYPRSLSTAIKSAGYFERFNKDYSFCINSEFDQIYATSSRYSWTDGKQFKEFCKAAGIACEELSPDTFFNEGMCDGAFKTREYTYDAILLRDYFIDKIKEYGSGTDIRYGEKITAIVRNDDEYVIRTDSGKEFASGFVLNASYAGVNGILSLAGFEGFGIKYELCEIILTEPSDALRDIGITVMDGPFFSIMPFGKTGMHSLTSVSFTPHITSYRKVPSFKCQERAGKEVCSSESLGNCSDCAYRPRSAWPYMDRLARKYMLPEYDYKYVRSLFSMKPILKASELDDSRPTAIRVNHDSPKMISVLSGKINTVYDLDEVL